MKTTHLFTGICLLLVAATACQKEIDLQWGKLPVVQPAPGRDTSQTQPTDTVALPPADTAQPAPPAPPVQIALKNPGFESNLKYWIKETAYTGKYGFTASVDAVRTGKLGLNFYASQKTHWAGAPQETPWNGTIYQTVSGLADGRYEFTAWADAVGDGMYLWADGGVGEAKVLIKSEINEQNTLTFEVKGGVAKIGFTCINAGGSQQYAPYFHADDVELWKK